jgi:hypothetical protein
MTQICKITISLFLLTQFFLPVQVFAQEFSSSYCQNSPQDLAQAFERLYDSGDVCDINGVPFDFLPACTFYTDNSGRVYYCTSREEVLTGTNPGEIKESSDYDLNEERTLCTRLYDEVARYTFPSDNDVVFNGCSEPVTNEDTGRCETSPKGVSGTGVAVSESTNVLSAQIDSINFTLKGCIIEEAVTAVRFSYQVGGKTGFTDSIPLGSDGSFNQTFNLAGPFELTTSNAVFSSDDPSGYSTTVRVISQQENNSNEDATITPPGQTGSTISDQFGPCNCGGGVQCSGEGNDRKVTKFPTVGTEEYQCVLCLGVTGNTWVGGLGCINTTPQGIFLQIIRISMGVMGGIALLRLIFLGYQYQFGDQKQIQAARDGVLSTLAAIVVVLFSVLLLRIIGVNILDVVPSGFFGN